MLNGIGADFGLNPKTPKTLAVSVKVFNDSRGPFLGLVTKAWRVQSAGCKSSFIAGSCSPKPTRVTFRV